jgi:uridylate kinase
MAQYKRVLIKLSGEALGDNGRLFDFEQIDRVAGIIGKLHDTGAEIAIVIGAVAAIGLVATIVLVKKKK